MNNFLGFKEMEKLWQKIKKKTDRHLLYTMLGAVPFAKPQSPTKAERWMEEGRTDVRTAGKYGQKECKGVKRSIPIKEMGISL